MDRCAPWSRRLVAALVGLTLAAGAACGGPAESDRSESSLPPTVAEQWFTNFHDAQRQGVINLPPFLDPDVVLDHRGLTLRDIVIGEEAALAYVGSEWGPHTQLRTAAAPIYLSRSGAVELAHIAPTNGMPFHAVFIDQIGADGITSEVHAGSELSWRRSSKGDGRRVEMHQRARDYVAAWSSADATAVRALYAQDATMTDSMTALLLSGAARIAMLAEATAAADGLPRVTLDSLPDFGGPADFAAGIPNWRDPQPLETQVLLVTVDDGTGCPGHLAIALDLDVDGRITAEHRHHRADDLARCTGGVLPSGWWDEVTVPPAVTIELTGTLDVAGHEVQVFNGTEGLGRLIGWAFGRYSLAGLPPPAVDSVTFLAHRTDKCDAIVGLIEDRQVTLCFLDKVCATAACDSWTEAARTTALHELAHAWIDDHVSTEMRKAFLTAAGLKAWSAADVDWGERGVELAASTMAWGLLEAETSLNPRLGHHSCAELTHLFELLVGDRTQPFPTCNPAP